MMLVSHIFMDEELKCSTIKSSILRDGMFVFEGNRKGGGG